MPELSEEIMETEIESTEISVDDVSETTIMISDTDESYTDGEYLSEDEEISDVTASEYIPGDEEYIETSEMSEMFSETELSETDNSHSGNYPHYGDEEIQTEITILEDEKYTTEITGISESPSTADLLEEEVIETSVSETSAVIISETPGQQGDQSSFTVTSDMIFYALVLAAAAVFGVVMFVQSRRRKSPDGKKSAKQRDNERISEQKREENKKKAEKNTKTKKKQFIPRTVKDTIPYQKCLENDIWLIGDKLYSKVYSVEDINYNLGDEVQQENVVDDYCTFLDTLDETVTCQICVRNYAIDVAEQEKDIIISKSDDGFNEFRGEYNDKVLRYNLSKGNNAIRKQILVTMTIECPDFETAKRKFNSIDLTIKNSFDHIGNTQLRPLTNKERTEVLKDFFIGAEYKMPDLTQEDYDKELEKTYLAPDYFEFKTDYFMFGDYYAKCVFIKEYPNNASDTVINDLMAANLQMMCTTTILAFDTAKARKLVQRQIGAITGDMGAREAKAAKAGFFSQQMPVKIQNQLDSYKELFNMITNEDEKLFITNTLIMIKEKSYEELNTSMEIVNSTLKRNGFAYSEMKWQQEDGLRDCLPVGSKHAFQWNRSLPTESVGILVPFNVKEVRMKNSIYYGLNKLSNNIIMFNRIKALINPAGFILGCPGSGKSFSAKREMIDVYMRYPEAEIIIIDPEREYPSITNMFGGQSIKVATSSVNYINPFDFDLSLLRQDEGDDEKYDVIKEKALLITSFIACMYTNRDLTPQEVSFIDRCVRLTYKKSGFFQTLDPEDMPILEDFYNVMSEETENVDPVMKRDMLATMEMYVGEGSANYFNHRTNVDVYNRLVSFDIKDLSGVLKTQALLLVLDNIWNRLSANRDRHIPTWIYCDEIHVLFSNDYCLEFFQGLYKRARKYGGVLTGITQNVMDLLRNESCCTMLANSEFLLLLKQSPSDSLKLQEVLHFTDSEIFFCQNTGSGEGLLVLGGKDKIPFYDKFPTDTKLYKSMSTAFSETQAVLKKSG